MPNPRLVVLSVDAQRSVTRPSNRAPRSVRSGAAPGRIGRRRRAGSRARRRAVPRQAPGRRADAWAPGRARARGCLMAATLAPSRVPIRASAHPGSSGRFPLKACGPRRRLPRLGSSRTMPCSTTRLHRQLPAAQRRPVANRHARVIGDVAVHDSLEVALELPGVHGPESPRMPGNPEASTSSA